MAYSTDPIQEASASHSPPQGAYQAVEFKSDGAVLEGRLYVPDRQPAAVVVMAHGYSATIPMVMDRYAECFREHGLHPCVAFDRASQAEADFLARTFAVAG